MSVSSVRDISRSAGFPGLNALRAELTTNLQPARWGRALIAIGWIHLSVFAVCQYWGNYAAGIDLRYPAAWLAELVAIVAVLRFMVGADWSRSSTLLNLASKVWITFLILSFNVASLNALTGYANLNWYKPVWAVLSTFMFAAFAWLMSPRFLLGAVWMYFTGLAMARFPDANFAIYGVSWWIAFQYLGIKVAQIRRAA